MATHYAYRRQRKGGKKGAAWSRALKMALSGTNARGRPRHDGVQVEGVKPGITIQATNGRGSKQCQNKSSRASYLEKTHSGAS